MNKKKVLIVEDERPIQKALEIKFLASGFDVKTADNGQEGVVFAREFIPDIILLDIMMPVKDGMETLREIKADDALVRVPVIMLTNFNDPEKITEAIALGAVDYAVKADWKMEDIVEKVKQKTQ